jgi:hypothetical protein
MTAPGRRPPTLMKTPLFSQSSSGAAVSICVGVDWCVVADVQFHGFDAERPQPLGGLAVLALHTAHRRVHRVAGAVQGFRRFTAKAAASAGDQDCLGHTRRP